VTSPNRYPLVVGYHRPPVVWGDRGWQAPASPNGILPTLTAAVPQLPGATWAALAVDMGLTPKPDGPAVGIPLSLLPVRPAHWTCYFHRACKETLWPVLMSEPERMRHDPSTWHCYRTINARFAAHIARLAAPGATVCLHDYNLWLVPGLLRAHRPDVRIGLFHHTPFPRPKTLAVLPTAKEVLDSLAHLDWAGFHTADAADHFRRALGAARPRTPRVGVHPIGVDRAAVGGVARCAIRSPLSAPEHRRVLDRTRIVVLSVERLDYVKAPVQKVDAIDTLLRRRPGLRGRLVFRLVCPPPEPGITAYDTTARSLDERIEAVNGRWRTSAWQPIEYLPHALPFPEVVAEYLDADVFWVTSLRDGMNLTAKEFIAAQEAVDGCGVLVLSRRTGAAVQLGSAALLTDPTKPSDLVSVLDRALRLSAAERRARLTRLTELLGDFRPVDWVRLIMGDIGRSGPVAALS